MTTWTRKTRAGAPGPWHVLGRLGLTLCGRRLPGLTYRRKVEPEPGERRCAECARRAAEGTQRAYRRA